MRADTCPSIHGRYIYDFLFALLVLLPSGRLAASQAYGDETSLVWLMNGDGTLQASYS